MATTMLLMATFQDSAMRIRMIRAMLLALCIALPAPARAADPLDAGAALLEKVAKSPVRKFSTRDFGREPYAGARSALVAETNATDLLQQLRRDLPGGLVAFIGTTRSLTEPPAIGVELVVAPGKEQFDILRIAASDAVNYNMTTDDLIKELRSWDREYGINITQAETDTIVVELRTLPANMKSFAKRVYKFCPDVVDQGVGDIASLVQEISRTRKVYLWWD